MNSLYYIWITVKGERQTFAIIATTVEDAFIKATKFGTDPELKTGPFLLNKNWQ
jgi:hypothetical protein